jgi:hypothetical protein
MTSETDGGPARHRPPDEATTSRRHLRTVRGQTVGEIDATGQIVRISHRTSTAAWTHLPGERYRYWTDKGPQAGRGKDRYGWVEMRCDCAQIPTDRRTGIGRREPSSDSWCHTDGSSEASEGGCGMSGSDDYLENRRRRAGILLGYGEGDRVTEVSLIRAPEGCLDDSESGVLWQITSKTGSTQDRHDVGATPAGFVEDVPLSRVPGEAEGLAATIDSEFDAQALIAFVPSELRPDQVLEPDGYFTPRQFETRHQDRCQY